MARPLTSMFAFYILTPGRRIYALGRVLERAKAKGLDDLAKMIAEAIAHDRQTLELDAARLVGTKISLRNLDAEVDSNLMMIDRLLEHYSKKGNAEAEMLSALLFPIDVAHHVQLAYVEQAVANERVLGILEANDRKPWLEAHGLWPLVEQLRAAHDVFVNALAARDAATAPSWDEVKAARELGQELYLGIVASIVASFLKDPSTRDELLEPIWAQEDLIRSLRRQRRIVAEVDPDSGDAIEPSPLEGDEAPPAVGDALQP